MIEEEPSPSVSATARPLRSHPAIPAVLVLSLAVAAIAPPTLGVLSALLISDFGLSRTQVGLLVTMIGASGALLAPISGRVADRTGWKLGFGIIFGSAMVATLGLALSPTFLWLLVAMSFAGLTNSLADPLTNRFIVETIPAGRRGRIIGVKQSGAQLGMFAVGALLPLAAVSYGWRPAAATIAVVPLIGLALTATVLPRRSRTAQRDSAPSRLTVTPPALQRGLSLYAVLMGCGTAVVVSFSPLYAQERIGMTLGAAGAIAATIGLVGAVGRVVWAARAERSGRLAAALAGLAIISVVAMVLFIAAPTIGAWAMWAGAALAGASLAAWLSVAMLTIVSAVEQHEVGKVSGAVVSGFLVGFTISPTAFAWTVDATGAYWPAWSGVALLSALAAGVGARLGRWLPPPVATAPASP